jgi:hypothetical protein
MVSSEDTKCSGSRVREDEFRSHWLLRDFTTSKEYETHSRGVDIGEDGEEPLREWEEALAIMNGLVQIHVGISSGYLTGDDERRWRNPLFEPPPLHICNQEEISIDNMYIGV